MDFQNFAERLKQQLKKPLPGSSAHEPLRAIAVGNSIPKFEHTLPPRPGSVLILLYEEEGKIKFPLIKRAEYVGAHSGQISLPGGKAEAGEGVIQTALREAEEEIGIALHKVNVLGALSDFFVIPSNFLVTPIVATTAYTVFYPDPREVVKILSADVMDLLTEGSIKKKEILAGKFQMMAPHFEIEGEVVWGATAMILNEFRHVLLESLNT